MPECDHCKRHFEDEQVYLEHLAEQHYEELGRIDKRRVESTLDLDAEKRSSLKALAGAGAVLLLLGGVAYVVTSTDSGGDANTNGQQSTGLGSIHIHGTLIMKVDGKRVNFSQPKYQLQADAFHFENGNGVKWHVHAQGVTLKWAMETLGITVTKDSVIYQGTTYRANDSATSITITANGNPITPADYVFNNGDTSRIKVIINE